MALFRPPGRSLGCTSTPCLEGSGRLRIGGKMPPSSSNGQDGREVTARPKNTTRFKGLCGPESRRRSADVGTWIDFTTSWSKPKP